tara:strand:+ start:3050 stop:6349 length:3300 start_codon:yes stop_codon:yes gene_type:complete
MYNYTNYIIYIIILLLIIYILYYIYIKNINIENFYNSQCNIKPKTILKQDDWFTDLKNNICHLYATQEINKGTDLTYDQLKLLCRIKLLPNLIEGKDENGAKISQGLSAITNKLQISVKHIDLIKYILNSKLIVNCEIPAYPLIWIKINEDETNEPNNNLILLKNDSIEESFKGLFGPDIINLTQQEYDDFNIQDLRVNHYIEFKDQFTNNIIKYKPKLSQIEFDYNVKLGSADNEYILNKDTDEDLCLTNNYCHKNDNKCIKNSDKNNYIENYSLKFMRWIQSDNSLENTINTFKVIDPSSDIHKDKHDKLVELAKNNNFLYFDLTSLSQEEYDEYNDIFNQEGTENKRIYIQLRNSDEGVDPTKTIFYYEPKPLFYDTNYLAKKIDNFNHNLVAQIEDKLRSDDGTVDSNPCIIDKLTGIDISQGHKFDLSEYLPSDTEDILEGVNFTKYGKIEDIKESDNITGPPDERYSKLSTYLYYKNRKKELNEDCKFYKSSVIDEPGIVKDKLPENGYFETTIQDNLVKWGKNTNIPLDNLTTENGKHHIQNKHVTKLQEDIDDEINNCKYTLSDIDSWKDTDEIDYNGNKYGIIRDEDSLDSYMGGYIKNQTAREKYNIEKNKCKNIRNSNGELKNVISNGTNQYGRISDTLTFDNTLPDEELLNKTFIHNSMYPYIENDYARKTIDKVCFAESLNDSGNKIYGEIGNNEGEYGKIGQNCNQYIKSADCSARLRNINAKITSSLSQGDNKRINKQWDNIENKEICFWNKIESSTNTEKVNLDSKYGQCLDNLLENGYDNETHDYTNPPIYDKELIKKTYIERTKLIWTEENPTNIESNSLKIDISEIIPENVKSRIANEIKNTSDNSSYLQIAGYSKITENEWRELLNNNHYKLSELSNDDIDNIYFKYYIDGNTKYYITKDTNIYWKNIYNLYNTRYENKEAEQKQHLHTFGFDCSTPDNYLKLGEQCTTDNHKCLHKDNKTQAQLDYDITNLPNTVWYSDLIQKGKDYAETNLVGRYYDTTLGPQCQPCTNINNTQPSNYIERTTENGYCNTDGTMKCSDKSQYELNTGSKQAYDWMIDYEDKCRTMNEISCIRQKDLL